MQVAFDIYGRIWEDCFNNKLFLPFRRLGQDEELGGRYYNRFRYYDSNSGIYISKDPIGLAGNNPNLYAYVHDSNTQVDSFGLMASNLNKLNSKLSALENAQSGADRIRNLSDGRTRYYGTEKPSRTPDPTRVASYVMEYDPKTGNVRSWMESYNHSGNVNRVHPKMKNGEVLDLPHYPPTKADIDSGKATSSGKAIKGCH